MCMQNWVKTEVMSSSRAGHLKALPLFYSGKEKCFFILIKQKVSKTHKSLKGSIPIATLPPSLSLLSSHCLSNTWKCSLMRTWFSGPSACTIVPSQPQWAHSLPLPTLFKYHLSLHNLHTLPQNSRCPKFLLYSFVHRKWYNLLTY